MLLHRSYGNSHIRLYSSEEYPPFIYFLQQLSSNRFNIDRVRDVIK